MEQSVSFVIMILSHVLVVVKGILFVSSINKCMFGCYGFKKRKCFSVLSARTIPAPQRIAITSIREIQDYLFTVSHGSWDLDYISN